MYSVTIGRADGEAIALSEVRVTVTADASGAVGRWFPAAYQYSRGVRQTWNSATVSEYMFDTPIYSYYRSDDANLLTAAIDDTRIPWRFRCGIDESLRMLRFTASSDGVCACRLTFRVFVDRSPRPYYEAIRDVARWWAECNGQPVIPACAYDPVYSTWYALHRDIDAENVLAECETAAKLGMKTVFVDDGWATPAESDGFAHAGDWVPNPDKFPDFKGFVDRIHALGMKAVLWVAPGLCGYATTAARRFAERSLSAHDGYRAYILDPRDPAVRDALVQALCAILTEYGFGGLKIDFVDVIRGADTAIDETHDHASVAEALELFYRRSTGSCAKSNRTRLWNIARATRGRTFCKTRTSSAVPIARRIFSRTASIPSICACTPMQPYTRICYRSSRERRRRIPRCKLPMFCLRRRRFLCGGNGCARIRFACCVSGSALYRSTVNSYSRAALSRRTATRIIPSSRCETRTNG